MTFKIFRFLTLLGLSCCLGGVTCASALPPPEAEEIAIVVTHDQNGLSTVPARLWRAAGPVKAGVLFITGVDGGFGEPLDEIYSRLAPVLAQQGVTSVFVSYRYPGEVEYSRQDALAGAALLRKLGAKKMALVGWSFGGAVAIHSAVHIPEAVTVIGIAAQARDAESVSEFKRQSLLILHSEQDENVPFDSARAILDQAPMEILKVLLPFAQGDHYLTGMGSALDPVFERWLKTELELG